MYYHAIYIYMSTSVSGVGTEDIPNVFTNSNKLQLQFYTAGVPVYRERY